jgi:hypothetical protein
MNVIEKMLVFIGNYLKKSTTYYSNSDNTS